MTAKPPDVELKTTGIPVRKLLLASRTKAVIVALVEPLEGISGKLVSNVTAATLAVVPLLLLLELTVANELVPLPPQPAAAASHASIKIHPKFRIVFT
ncbi:MAG: hypothetical protein ACLQFT_10940 [Steroidobacteraceae bacterium]